MQIGKILKNIDTYCDYVPVVSTVFNAVDLFQKVAVLPFLSETTINNSHYYSHLKHKEALRSIVLLVPVLGNIVVMICDSMSRIQVFGGNGTAEGISNFSRAFGWQKDSRREVLIAVSPYGTLHNDPQSLAVRANAFNYASERLKNDRNFVLDAVERNGLVIEYVDDHFKEDEEIVLAAVEQNGLALQFVNDRFKADREVVLDAVKQNCRALQYASDELRKDGKFVLEAAREYGDARKSDIYRDQFSLPSALKLSLGIETLRYASRDLFKDKEFILSLASECDSALDFAADELKEDREFILSVVKVNGKTLKSASEEFKKDEEVVAAAVDQYKYAIRFADEAIQEQLKNLSNTKGAR